MQVKRFLFVLTTNQLREVLRNIQASLAVEPTNAVQRNLHRDMRMAAAIIQETLTARKG